MPGILSFVSFYPAQTAVFIIEYIILNNGADFGIPIFGFIGKKPFCKPGWQVNFRGPSYYFFPVTLVHKFIHQHFAQRSANLLIKRIVSSFEVYKHFVPNNVIFTANIRRKLISKANIALPEIRLPVENQNIKLPV